MIRKHKEPTITLFGTTLAQKTFLTIVGLVLFAGAVMYAGVRLGSDQSISSVPRAQTTPNNQCNNNKTFKVTFRCGDECSSSNQCPLQGCSSCATANDGKKRCGGGGPTPTRTPTPTSGGGKACASTKPNSRWATDLGLVSGRGVVKTAQGLPYFDPNTRTTFSVTIPKESSVAFIACYDCDHYGETSGKGWKISWSGGSFEAITKNNKWEKWIKNIQGQNTVNFDNGAHLRGGGDSAGGNVCINP